MFVSNLAPTVTEEAIKELFGSIGIIKVNVLVCSSSDYFICNGLGTPGKKND